MMFTLKLFTIALLVTSLSFGTSAQTIFGEANLFSYDATGNRILRVYVIDAVLHYKKGSTGTTDTVLVEKKDSSNLSNNNIVVKAYPNPVTEQLTIENMSWQNDDVAIVKILNEAGQIISQKQILLAKDDIPFTGIASGVYYVQYLLRKKTTVTWKVIKL